MRTTKLLPIVVAFALAGWMIFPATAAPPKPAENLLQDPSFEESWRWNTWDYLNIVKGLGKGHPVDVSLSFGEPYFGSSESKWDKEQPRQDESVAGEVSGPAYWKFRAGYYQNVDVPPRSRVRFSVWVNGFCEDEQTQRCPIILRAGIDPNGGYDWQSSNIRWVETKVADQKYVQLTTEATVGLNGSVTVFTWGEPIYAVRYTAAYFDEASLVIIPRSASTPAPTPTATLAVVPTPSPTPTSAATSKVAPAPAPAITPHAAPPPAPAPPSDHEDQEDD